MHPSDLEHPVFRRAVSAMLLPDSAFVPVQPLSQDLAQVWQSSKGAVSFFLEDAVDPYRGATGARWMAKVAEPGGSDLLRAKYSAGELQLTLTESINFVVLNAAAPLSIKNAADKKVFLKQLIYSVVRLKTQDHEWHFDIPDALETEWNRQVITTRNAPPIRDIQTRDDRADILIMNDSVYFLFYPKISQMDGWPAEDRWFPPQARQALLGSRR